ncbi:hypothetical protein Cantr_01310 [Candida viswanathii]|uniref:Uncharacterized protein n=1 Tax=Candida viswanathii TaxID=5486 RepID=A0A367YIE6_9ASCO|nr:hypothetical protein Cantr_01310 [Candida viswanathii]
MTTRRLTACKLLRGIRPVSAAAMGTPSGGSQSAPAPSLTVAPPATPATPAAPATSATSKPKPTITKSAAKSTATGKVAPGAAKSKPWTSTAKVGVPTGYANVTGAISRAGDVPVSTGSAMLASLLGLIAFLLF